MMRWTLGVGPLGDLLTFVGSLLLAWDVVQKEREFKGIRSTVEALKEMGRLKIAINVGTGEIVVKDQEEVQLAYLRRSARKAVWGCFLLAGGFFLVAGARALELLGR